MRKGCFPVYPRDDCSEHCGFQTICRYAEWRVERKWKLNPIPELDPLPPGDETADGHEEGDA
jgi:hypothetical protein